MKNKITGWLAGGLITASVLGVAFGFNPVGNAAAKTEQAVAGHSMMMQQGQMNQEMMSSPEMQKQCAEMMQNPEMQKMMKQMLQQPQMQTMMKQMLSGDPEFKQMLLDLINSVEDTTTGEQAPASARNSMPMDHNAHHFME
ncbi:hypothetical protein [Sporomusa aerivorans]|uniref:hypothetical protein n=1 Tax=Sporomusa aerivorans TaxID=204936 RepID=UPI00352B15E0